MKNEKVSIAVVGIRGSGKSYLLSDIITSFANHGYTRHDIGSDEYASIGSYRAKINNGGKVSQTEVYACRPKENIFGATYEGHGKKLDVDFVDIPGEVFNGEKQVKDNTFLGVFTSYKAALLSAPKKLFTVSVWENAGGLQQLIVEPILTGQRKEEFEKRKQASEFFNAKEFQEDRVKAFQGWSNIFSWLNANGYEKKPIGILDNILGSTKITGKELLKNFFKYQPDSLMQSLAEIVDIICPRLNIDCDDFCNNHNLEAFYFLYYCSQATDIVLCDKLFVPEATKKGECTLDTDENYDKYTNITNQLYDFIRTEKANVYLAFRGVDYLLRAQKDHYVALIKQLKNNGKSNDEIRNISYSLFSYYLWNHIDEVNAATDGNMFEELVGIENEKNKNLARHFIDFDCVTGEGQNFQLDQIIPQHVGDDSGDAFRQLLQVSYGFTTHEACCPMRAMPPHTYFTCTPITSKFEVYVNDPECKNTRFVHPNPKAQGPTKYFDTAGSNFCFGTYQLCIDILNQHDVNVDDWSSFKNLIQISIGR